MSDLEFYILAFGIFAIFATIVIGLSGFVGPKRYREYLRKLNTWYFRDSAIFGPLDPYAPSMSSMIKSSLKEFLPTRKRWQQLNRPLPWGWALIICSYLIVLTCLVLI